MDCTLSLVHPRFQWSKPDGISIRAWQSKRDVSVPIACSHWYTTALSSPTPMVLAYDFGEMSEMCVYLSHALTGTLSF